MDNSVGLIHSQIRTWEFVLLLDYACGLITFLGSVHYVCKVKKRSLNSGASYFHRAGNKTLCPQYFLNLCYFRELCMSCSTAENTPSWLLIRDCIQSHIFLWHKIPYTRIDFAIALILYEVMFFDSGHMCDLLRHTWLSGFDIPCQRWI